MEAQISEAIDERLPVRLRDLFFPLLALAVVFGTIALLVFASAMASCSNWPVQIASLGQRAWATNLDALLAVTSVLYAAMLGALYLVCRRRGPATFAGYFARPTVLRILGGAATGILLAFAALGLIIALRTMGFLLRPETTSSLLMSARSPIQFGFLIFAVAGLAPLAEEIYFRGLLLSFLRNRMRLWLAVCVSAAIFALIHIRFVHHPDLSGWALTGLLWSVGSLNAVTYLRTRSLWIPVMTHGFYNASLMFFAYAAVWVTTTRAI